MSLGAWPDKLIAMPHITTDHADADAVDLYYEDSGSGQPVVLVHGYPLDARFWEKQICALLSAGYRTIAYDRRGFGRSTASPDGADFDTFAADLDSLATALDLTDTVLVGHAMGAGEIARYLRRYGTARVTKVALVAPLLPYLLHTDETPHGLDLSHFDAQITRAHQDPAAFLAAYIADFFNVAEVPSAGVDATTVATWTRLAASLPSRTCASAIPTWITDFRPDIAAITVPALIVHGARDRILPITATSRPLRDLLPHATYTEIAGAPHGLLWTHSDEVNKALLDFLAG